MKKKFKMRESTMEILISQELSMRNDKINDAHG